MNIGIKFITVNRLIAGAGEIKFKSSILCDMKIA